MSSEKAKRGLYSSNPFTMEHVSHFDVQDSISEVTARLTDNSNPDLQGLDIQLSSMDEDYQFFVNGAGRIGGLLENWHRNTTRVTLVQHTNLLRYVWLSFGMLIAAAMLSIIVRIGYMPTMVLGFVFLVALFVFENSALHHLLRRVENILRGKRKR